MESSYRRTLKEAIVAAVLWFGAGVWVISVSYWLGSHRAPHSIGGIPHWVVWGVLVPWVVLFVIHSWYSLVFMRAEDDVSRPSNPPSGLPPQTRRDG